MRSGACLADCKLTRLDVWVGAVRIGLARRACGPAAGRGAYPAGSAEAALKQAEARIAAADGRVAATEEALHAAYADREATWPERYAARQTHERASALVERLQRRAGELTGRLSRMPLCPDMTRYRFVSVF
jgi:hypothetical protein